MQLKLDEADTKGELEEALAENDEKKPQPKANGKKRASDAQAKPAPIKRQKKVVPKKEESDEEEEEPALGELSESEEVEPKKRAKRPVQRGRKRKVATASEDDTNDNDVASTVVMKGVDDDGDSDNIDAKSPTSRTTTGKMPKKVFKGAAKKTYKGTTDSDNSSALSEAALGYSKDEEDDPKPTVNDDDSSELSSVIDDGPPKKKRKSKVPATKKGPKKAKPAANDGSESEMSSVIDDGPPKKGRKSKQPAAKKAPAKKGPAKAAAKLSPDQAEIKKLQSYLIKCGVRKLWGNELKKFGDDSTAKISHLKKMLSDVGMDGRFSEQKAKEIKSKRELAADIEAVTLMNDMWGVDGKRTSRKSAPKSFKGVDAGAKDDEDEENEDDENNDDGDDDDDDGGYEEDTKGKSSSDDGSGDDDDVGGSKRKSRPGLDFLDDDEDDSD